MSDLSTGVFDVSKMPTVAHFLADHQTEICAIMSHVGAGKTSNLVVKAFKLGLIQPPCLKDGVRYTRTAFIRGTTSQLIRGLLPTFQKWIPPTMCEVRQSAPMNGKITGLKLHDQNQHFPEYMVREGKKFPYLLGCSWDPVEETFVGGIDVSGQRIGDTFPEGTTASMDFQFLALDNPDFRANLLGMELTHASFDENDQFSPQVLEQVIPEVQSRMGRFPSADVCHTLYSQINMAYNPPKKGSFLHKFFDPKNQGPDRKLYRVQPPFLMIPDKEDPKNAHKAVFKRNPDAEGVHLQSLGFKYWEKDIEANRHNLSLIQRRVLGQYTDQDGNGDIIHPLFRMDLHVSKQPLQGSRGRVLFASFDHGLNGAMVTAQVENGGIRILEELLADGVPAHQFIKNSAVPHLNSEYRGYDIIVTGDPSGAYARDTGDSPFAILEDLGFIVEADISNDPSHRWSAVNNFLMYQDGMLIDPECEKVIEAFDGGYTYKVTLTGQNTGKADKANPLSAPMDCIQAICQLVMGGYETASNEQFANSYGTVTDHKQPAKRSNFLWV